MGLCFNIASFFYIEKKIQNITNIQCIGNVISIKEEKTYTNKYIIKILESNSNYNMKNIKLIVYTSKDMEFFPGDIIYIKGDISAPDSKRNYGGFDYNNYLKQLKIFGIINAEECEKITVKKDIYSFLENVRYKLLIKLEILYNDENSEFLKGLLFGKNDSLSDEIKESFKRSSLSHVLAISGMHVSYVIIGINLILNKCIRNKKIKNNFLIFCIIFFSFITGNSVSGIRACIMGIMNILANNFERKNNFYISLIYSFFIIILFNPYNIYNVGLWLSYMGSLGIVCFSLFFKKYIYKKINFNKNNKTVLKILKEYFVENLVVTVSAQILIFPIMVYVFNTFSILFFVSNILVSIFIGPILILGYISLILYFLNFPFLKIIVDIEELLIMIVIEISKNCSKLPFSQINVITPKFIWILLYYGIVLFLIYFSYIKKFYLIKLCISKHFFKKEFLKLKDIICLKMLQIFQKICGINKETNKFFIKRKILILFIIIAICFSEINCKNCFNFEINFVNVGQGDCTYIKTPFGKNIIIDGGEGNTKEYDYGENVVLPYLLDRGIKKIDYVIISHADSDHIGGVFSILENIKVDKILIGIQPKISEHYSNLLALSKNKNIDLIYLKAGDILKIEKEIYLKTLWPKDDIFVEENELNNNSLVFKLCYKNFSVLFTGDIEEIAEKDLLKLYEHNLEILNATVLKVAHHGSKTSSSISFLKNINPKIALIGVGKNNKFGHPSESVIEKLQENNVQIYRTDKNGEINIKFTFNTIRINTMYR